MRGRYLVYLKWLKMLMGRSYYHQRQRMGKAFQPGRIEGFFNDLTAKTRWIGICDENGIPMNLRSDGVAEHYPTTIIQKALGHFDVFILEDDLSQKVEFLRLCEWLLGSQDSLGGWSIRMYGQDKFPSVYSAMTQGEAVSAFVRAWKLTNEDRYLRGAEAACDLIIRPVKEGGTAVYRNREIFLEEYPSYLKNTVLNGWIFALFGLYDIWLATSRSEYNELFQKSFSTLKNSLPAYDAGYWSYYDEQGTLASPFYHDLHVSQLEALYLISEDEIINWRIERWKYYQKSSLRRNRAFMVKAMQKLRNPQTVEFIS